LFLYRGRHPPVQLDACRSSLLPTVNMAAGHAEAGDVVPPPPSHLKYAGIAVVPVELRERGNLSQDDKD
jgi:hypothetical protein